MRPISVVYGVLERSSELCRFGGGRLLEQWRSWRVWRVLPGPPDITEEARPSQAELPGIHSHNSEKLIINLYRYRCPPCPVGTIEMMQRPITRATNVPSATTVSRSIPPGACTVESYCWGLRTAPRFAYEYLNLCGRPTSRPRPRFHRREANRRVPRCSRRCCEP